MLEPAEDRLKQNPSQRPIWKPLKTGRARAAEDQARGSGRGWGQRRMSFQGCKPQHSDNNWRPGFGTVKDQRSLRLHMAQFRVSPSKPGRTQIGHGFAD